MQGDRKWYVISNRWDLCDVITTIKQEWTKSTPWRLVACCKKKKIVEILKGYEAPSQKTWASQKNGPYMYESNDFWNYLHKGVVSQTLFAPSHNVTGVFIPFITMFSSCIYSSFQPSFFNGEKGSWTELYAQKRFHPSIILYYTCRRSEPVNIVSLLIRDTYRYVVTSTKITW